MFENHTGYSPHLPEYPARTPSHCWGWCKLGQPLWKTIWLFSTTAVCTQRNTYICSPKDMHTDAHNSLLYNSPKAWDPPQNAYQQEIT